MACYTLDDAAKGFNSQPPEGGWVGGRRGEYRADRFNSQPPEGGWV